MIDRIKQVMEFYKLTPATLAEQIGINRSNLTHLFSGRNQPSLELARKILLNFPKIKTEWLIMGVGQMLKNEDDVEYPSYSAETENNIDLFTPHIEDQRAKLEIPKKQEQVYNIPEELSDIKEEVTNVPISDNETIVKKPVTVVTNVTDVKEVQLSKIIFFFTDNSFEVFQPKL